MEGTAGSDLSYRVISTESKGLTGMGRLARKEMG